MDDTGEGRLRSLQIVIAGSTSATAVVTIPTSAINGGTYGVAVTTNQWNERNANHSTVLPGTPMPNRYPAQTYGIRGNSTNVILTGTNFAHGNAQQYHPFLAFLYLPPG